MHPVRGCRTMAPPPASSNTRLARTKSIRVDFDSKCRPIRMGVRPASSNQSRNFSPSTVSHWSSSTVRRTGKGRKDYFTLFANIYCGYHLPDRAMWDYRAIPNMVHCSIRTSPGEMSRTASVHRRWCTREICPFWHLYRILIRVSNQGPVRTNI